MYKEDFGKARRTVEDILDEFRYGEPTGELVQTSIRKLADMLDNLDARLDALEQFEQGIVGPRDPFYDLKHP